LEGCMVLSVMTLSARQQIQCELFWKVKEKTYLAEYEILE
jgi:hypothetical protein